MNRVASISSLGVKRHSFLDTAKSVKRAIAPFAGDTLKVGVMLVSIAAYLAVRQVIV